MKNLNSNFLKNILFNKKYNLFFSMLGILTWTIFTFLSYKNTLKYPDNIKVKLLLAGSITFLTISIVALIKEIRRKSKMDNNNEQI